AFEVRADIAVAQLHGPHLSAIGQDLWLTKCDATHYVRTRRWAAAILAATDVSGLAYRCRHDEDRLAWMLTAGPESHTHPDLTPVAGSSLALDRGRGRVIVNRVLAAHSAALATGA